MSNRTVTFARTFLVRFDMRFASTYHALKGDYDADAIHRNIIPGRWDWKEDCDAPWFYVVFETEEFVEHEVLEEMRRKLQLLDDACEAMIAGTKADGKEKTT